MPNATWQYTGWRDEALIDANGQIIARVTGSHRSYYAHAGVLTLGEYINATSAKRAVERSLPIRTALDQKDAAGRAG